MAQNTCAITVTDYTGHREAGSSEVIHLEAVSMELTMFEVKELICGQKNNPAITAANTVLYMGKNVMEDKKQLNVYNRSRRTNLALELHDLVLVKITVKTLQHCGKGRCVMVPLWAFCCQQTISLKLPDYETVGRLRREIASELGDPTGHPAEKLQLHACGGLLDDDLQTLREAGLADRPKVTVFVRLCFFRRTSEAGMHSTEGDTSSKGAGAAAEEGEAAEEPPPADEIHTETKGAPAARTATAAVNFDT